MSGIKPPGGPRGPGGAQGPDAAGGAKESSGPSFSEVARGAKAAPTAPADPARAALAELRAGTITPDEAVRRIVDAAVARVHAPATLRPAIEQKVRALLARDPLVGELLRTLGATVPVESE